MELKQAVEELNLYIRPQTFPLAVKMAQEAEVPERARRPLRNMSLTMPVCQGIGIARRYGWTIAMGAEDNTCPYAAAALGFAPAKEGFLDGSYLGAFDSKEVAAKTAREMRRLAYGEYSHLVVAPAHSATFEPRFLLIYGSPAQVMRLVQGRLRGEGGWLNFRAAGVIDCSDIISHTLLSNECQLILPCNGDRIFGAAQDDEMAFTIPLSKLEMVLDGLKSGHQSGLQRYPIPVYLRFQPQLPPSYVQLMDYLEKEE